MYLEKYNSKQKIYFKVCYIGLYNYHVVVFDELGNYLTDFHVLFKDVLYWCA